MRIVARGGVLVVGLLLILAGTSKLLDPEPLANVLRLIGFGAFLANIALWTLPGLEIGIGIALLAGRISIPLLVSTVGLLIAFAIVLVRLMWIDSAMECQCFGALVAKWAGGSPSVGVIRNLVLAGLLVPALIRAKGGIAGV